MSQVLTLLSAQARVDHYQMTQTSQEPNMYREGPCLIRAACLESWPLVHAVIRLKRWGLQPGNGTPGGRHLAP